jgi:hypothetical protein
MCKPVPDPTELTQAVEWESRGRLSTAAFQMLFAGNMGQLKMRAVAEADEPARVAAARVEDNALKETSTANANPNRGRSLKSQAGTLRFSICSGSREGLWRL